MWAKKGRGRKGNEGEEGRGRLWPSSFSSCRPASGQHRRTSNWYVTREINNPPPRWSGGGGLLISLVTSLDRRLMQLRVCWLSVTSACVWLLLVLTSPYCRADVLISFTCWLLETNNMQHYHKPTMTAYYVTLLCFVFKSFCSVIVSSCYNPILKTFSWCLGLRLGSSCPNIAAKILN